MVARLARLARLASTLTATIFGSQGVFAAALWPLNSTDTYILAGFRAFRGFDGRTARFGDTSVQSTSTSAHDDVVYSSHDSIAPGRVVCVAIHRSTSAKLAAINRQPLSGRAYLDQPVAGSFITIPLPPLSATTIDAH